MLGICTMTGAGGFARRCGLSRDTPLSARAYSKNLNEKQAIKNPTGGRRAQLLTLTESLHSRSGAVKRSFEIN
jgi:hypothetical protein